MSSDCTTSALRSSKNIHDELEFQTIVVQAYVPLSTIECLDKIIENVYCLAVLNDQLMTP